MFGIGGLSKKLTTETTTPVVSAPVLRPQTGMDKLKAKVQKINYL